MAREDDADDEKAVAAAIRSAKKTARPTRIGEPEPAKKSKSKDKKKKRPAAGGKKITAKSGGAFQKDMGQKGSSQKGFAGEGARAKKTDTVKGLSSKKVKRPKK